MIAVYGCRTLDYDRIEVRINCFLWMVWVRLGGWSDGFHLVLGLLRVYGLVGRRIQDGLVGAFLRAEVHG
jgi:hypothetical protein